MHAIPTINTSHYPNCIQLGFAIIGIALLIISAIGQLHRLSLQSTLFYMLTTLAGTICLARASCNPNSSLPPPVQKKI